MVRSKKNVVLTRGGDEAVAGKSFYSSSAARPALKVLDTLLNTVAPNLKLKDKRPAKPKAAAQLYAEDKCEEMLLDSGLHESRSKLAIKSCKDDAMAAFKNGQVEQEVVEIYTEKEQAEKTVYERRVDEWNENHPDEKLVIGKNGTATLWRCGPERQKQKDKSSGDVAKKKKVNGPGTTKELQAISGNAAEKLKKLRAKKQLKAKKKKSSTKSDMDMLEDDDDEEEYSEEEPDVDISDDDDDDDNQENDKDEEPEQLQPVRSKAKMGASSETGGEKDAAVKKDKAGKEKATASRRKAESSMPEPEEQNIGTKASKRARSGTEKGSDAALDTEKKIASSKKRGKKERDHEPVADADDTAPRRKPTRASVKEQKMVATEQPPAKRNKKQAAIEGKTAKSKDASKQEALPAKSRLSSRTRKPQKSKKHLGPTMPKASPAKSNSAYTGDYDVPSDDE